MLVLALQLFKDATILDLLFFLDTLGVRLLVSVVKLNFSMDDGVVRGHVRGDTLGFATKLTSLFLLHYLGRRRRHKWQLVSKVSRACIELIFIDYLRPHEWVEAGDRALRHPLNRLLCRLI